MKAIIGKKIGMTRIFDENGKIIPVTIVESKGCQIIQIKNKEKDGYISMQIGYDRLNKKKETKTRKFKMLREFRLSESEVTELSKGNEVNVNIFAGGDIVKVIGISKGKGFQGTVRRHHFRTGPKTHGSNNYRQPGSIGATYPQRVIKGRRMAGHMGHEKITSTGLEIMSVDPEMNLLVIKGAVPGVKGNLVSIKGE